MSARRARPVDPDPALPGYVTDGGLETDLIFHHGVDLPEFAAFLLLADAGGPRPAHRLLRRRMPRSRRRPGPGCSWRPRRGGPTPTGAPGSGSMPPGWPGQRRRGGASSPTCAALRRRRAGGRASPGWWGRGRRLRRRARRCDPRAGPRLPPAAGRGSSPTPGADLVTALTLTDRRRGDRRRPGRAGGRGCRSRWGSPSRPTAGCPTAPRCARPSRRVDDVGAARPLRRQLRAPHPRRRRPWRTRGPGVERIGGTRVNASALSHAELDAAEELDEGDPAALGRDQAGLAELLPALRVVGGCCGTDARHVAAMWGVTTPQA